MHQICIDWAGVSSLTLVSSRIKTLPPALKSVKHLVLLYTNWELPLWKTPIVSQSIQNITIGKSDPRGFMLTMTLPSLRRLDVDITYAQTLSPITCDFLRRSLCPLQALDINYDTNVHGGQVIQALIDVLEITKMLQNLTFRMAESSDKSCFEPLVRRFSSQDRDFLPCLQTLSLNTRFIPPIDLLLDAMAPQQRRPLRVLDLDLCIPLRDVGPIRKDVLVRILQMQEDGKEIFITCTRHIPRHDLVESWKTFHGFRDSNSD